jgi:AraC-like DNA-binding protein
MNELCSARLLLPFMRLVTAQEALRDLVPEPFWSVSTDERIPLGSAQSMLYGAVERLRDEHLGLKQGRTMRFGEGGPYDYAVRSAPTLRDAVDVAGRYSRLQTDSFRVWLERWRSYAVIRVLDEVSAWGGACADFAMSAIHKIHLGDEMPPAAQLECWFPYAEPRDLSHHEQCFPGARLKFGAPFFGFAFNHAYESAPMPGADPVLHASHCARVEAILADISQSLALRTRLHHVIEQEIRYNRGSIAPRVARAMRLSPRTLSRRLKQEGMSFADELDAVRRQLAKTYVGESEVSLTEVAFLLGFSHVESFYRAFKRWTGETPLAYRERVTVARTY